MGPVVGYFWSANFWFASFLALLLALFYALKTTGPKSGPMRMQINLASTGNKFRVIGAFLVLELVLNPAVFLMGAGIQTVL